MSSQRIGRLLTGRSVPGWLLLGWTVLEQLHTAGYLTELTHRAVMYLGNHPGICIFIGFAWLGLVVTWPDLRKRIPPWAIPRTTYERIEAVENSLRELSEGLKVLEASVAQAEQGIAQLGTVHEAERVRLQAELAAERAKNGQAEKTAAGETPVPEDAPPLVVEHRNPGTTDESLVFLNDGDSTVVDLLIFPLMWDGQQRAIVLESAVPLIKRKDQEKRRVSVEDTQHNSFGLADFMRHQIPPDASASCSVAYGDSRGRRFSRKFLLTLDITDIIGWTPGPIRLLGSQAAHSA